MGLLVAPCIWSQGTPAIFPTQDLRPGMKGVGRTIFEGDKIETFQVEILGVLKNALAPKRDLVLARLSGGPLAKSGVIAGMSGSPVYIDGKLVGAVAISFPFSKEPIAGITPIEDMLRVTPPANPPPTQQVGTDLSYRVTRAAGGARLIPEEQAGMGDLERFLPAEPSRGAFAGVRLPLQLGGVPNDVVEEFAPLFRRLGFEPMQGGGISGSDASFKSDLEPGSMVSLLLCQGDLTINADCTVTFRDGNKLYACGHQVLSAGPAAFPFAPSRVLVTVPSLMSSFKVDTPGPVMGAIRQDSFSAIFGVVGDKSVRQIPVHIHVTSSQHKSTDYNFQIVQETFLSPLLLNLVTVSSLGNTERRMGPSTLDIDGKIELTSGDSVKIEDVLSGDMGTAALVGAVAATPLTYLLGADLPKLRIKDVDLSVVSDDEKRVASLEQVWSSQSEVRPGDHMEVTALLRLPGEQTLTQKIPVEIPESVTDKTLSLVVGSGASINALQMRFTPLTGPPRDLHQLIRALNRMRRNNRLYALLMAPQRSFVMQGDEYPSPPPSLIQTFLSDPAVSSSVMFSGTSVVGDFETRPSPYTIRGQKTLLLKVVGPGT